MQKLLRQIFQREQLWIKIDPQLKCAGKEDRARLRETLKADLQSKGLSLSAADLAKLSDLENPPLRIGDLFVSITHTTTAGGYLICDQPCGIDLELQARVSQKVIERVSTLEEVHASPHPSYLWAAKEAAFKAFHPFRPPLAVSQIKIGSWEKHSELSQAETFRVQNLVDFEAPSGMGCVIKEDASVLAVFVLGL